MTPCIYIKQRKYLDSQDNGWPRDTIWKGGFADYTPVHFHRSTDLPYYLHNLSGPEFNDRMLFL